MSNLAATTSRATRTAYEALHQRAVLVDSSARLRLTLSGEKALEALGGLVTNDVITLAPMGMMRAVALTPKGRVIALLRVVRREADIFVDTEAASGDGFAAMIRKFVNPRIAKHAVISESTGCLGVHGPDAAAALAPVLALDAATLESLSASHTMLSTDATLVILRSDALGVPGFDLVGERAAVDALRAKLDAAGLPVLDDATREIAEVERGLPRFGIEMDAETIPQEANLDQLDAISFNKGCYTGQEVVARIHFRGHVNRHLRRLTASEPLERGNQVFDPAGKEVGDVRSAVLSPRMGPIAVAMIRREVEVGTDVVVRHGERMIAARCEVLP